MNRLKMIVIKVSFRQLNKEINIVRVMKLIRFKVKYV